MIARLRRWLAELLARFEPDFPGAILPDRQFTVDDGVDYSLPLVVPDWLTPAQKQDLVTRAVTEASAVYHNQFDRPYLYSENLSQFPTADPLREWDFQTRREILARCHLAHERNPLANTAVGLTTMFSVGQGFTINYYNSEVKSILEEFRNHPDNAVQKYEKSFCDDLQIDGELFVTFAKDEGDGRTVIVPVRPWEIDWIQTEMGFAKRVVSYHQLGQQYTGKPGEAENIDRDIPAEEMLHATLNDHSYETRGRPELFRILPWLKAYKDWLEGRARQNHWRGSIIYDVSLEGATPTQVTAKRGQYKQPPSPGSIAIHNDKETWQILDSKVGAADVAEDGRQIKLMAAVGAKMPEYMLSDGSNANLASSKSQALPALRKFTDFQDILIGQVWLPIYDRVLKNAIEAGVLTEMVEEQDVDGEPVLDDLGQPKKIKALDAYDLSAPELESDDPATLAQAMQVAVTNSWVSDETASSRMGFDYTSEKKKIDREKQANVRAAAQGMAFGGQPPVEDAPGLGELLPAEDDAVALPTNGNGAVPPAQRKE